MASAIQQIRGKLRDHALGLPEAHEDLPWGERVVKVKKKVFVFLGRDMDRHLGIGVKLKASHASALALPGVTPMRYGLGKSGWVSARFEGTSKPSLELLRTWIDESYALVAPKSLAAKTPAHKPVKTRAKSAAKAPSVRKPRASARKKA
ncbi:MAG TPA: MmcQ/YjbR family DNA-binding protein [Polyangiaceae bacterium]|jgi:predicted DNA-binding protein (MmcQ/YjbR family)|nr:MmcQ/YjbR family DNA-binding protein [Polyangiaceae bacterium]